MTDDYFGWTTDTNGDGTPETLRYSTTDWLPTLDSLDGGRVVGVETLYTLNGGILTLTRTRPSRYDHTAPGRFALVWGQQNPVDPAFLPILEEDYSRNRLVSVRLDYHWRQLRVTSSGLADRKVTVEAGYLRATTGRSWLSADAEHTCGASDTYVYVTSSSGTLTVASGTSVPGGATQLAAITIAGDIVRVTTSPSGVANARTCKIIERPRFIPIGDGLATCEVVLQEQE